MLVGRRFSFRNGPFSGDIRVSPHMFLNQPRIDTLLRMEDALLNIRQAMFEREDLVCGQLQLIET